MLQAKEAGAMAVMLSTQDMADVKAARAMLGFVQWLIGLPERTRVAAETAEADLEKMMEDADV